jgi:hypothetical protein
MLYIPNRQSATPTLSLPAAGSVIVVIAPRGHDRWSVRLEAGAMLVKACRVPLCDAARALIGFGVDPHRIVAMRHEGSTAISLSAQVGIAAALSVEDDALGRSRFIRWPGPRGSGAAPPMRFPAPALARAGGP